MALIIVMDFGIKAMLCELISVRFRYIAVKPHIVQQLFLAIIGDNYILQWMRSLKILTLALAFPVVSCRSKFPVFLVENYGNYKELLAGTFRILLRVLGRYLIKNREILAIKSAHSVYSSCPHVYAVYLNCEHNG